MIRKFGIKFIITLLMLIILTTTLMPVKMFATSITDDPYLDKNQFDGYTGLADANVPGANQTFGGMIMKIGGTILTIVRIVALCWGMLMLISIAIKYMSGKAQVKAQLKTDIPTYLTGAVILFGSAGLITLIEYFMSDTMG